MTSKGLRHLSRLLASPGRELAALDLASPSIGAPGPFDEAMAEAADLGPDTGETMPLIDRQARHQYELRLRELQDDIDEATHFGDLERASRSREEFHVIAEELSAVLGLGRRHRRSTSQAKRARQRVTKAIQGTMKRLADEHPSLSEHLEHSIRTGRYCIYDPDPVALPRWTFDRADVAFLEGDHRADLTAATSGLTPSDQDRYPAGQRSEVTMSSRSVKLSKRASLDAAATSLLLLSTGAAAVRVSPAVDRTLQAEWFRHHFLAEHAADLDVSSG